MTYNTLLFVKLMLLIVKSLFAICQKRIYFHFALFGDYKFCSMLVRLLKEVDTMAERGGDCVLLPIYQYWTVYNLLKMRFFCTIS